MPSLVIKKPDGTDKTLTLGEKPVIVGRVADSDVPVRDAFVSRVHCGIGFTNNQFTLKDLGSTNGTYRNGARVFECALASGDKIHIGNTTLVFEVEASGNAILRQVPRMVAPPPPAPAAAPPPAKPGPKPA
jgi:pSer/pThr/pTyr-binding forkhead associated (FHA) protein